MFNRRLLSALGAITVIVVALAVWLNRPAANVDQAELAKFIPALKSQKDTIDLVVVQTKQQTLTFQLREKQWRVAERDGYLANNAKVRELLTAVADANIAETKTADPERYAKLGVEDNGEKSSVITIRAGEQELAHFIVGNSVPRPAGHYVRRVGQAQSLLLDRELAIGRDVRDWLDSDLLNVPATKVSKIERLSDAPANQCAKTPCETVTFTLSKSEGSAEFKIDNLPANKEMQAAHIVSGLTDVMNGLNANDVLKADKLTAEHGKRTVTRYYTDDKQIITIQYVAQADKHYVSFVIATAADASAEVKAAAEKLNNKFNGWLFEINAYKGEGLARSLDELTQKKELKK